jgi:hypothetical protein
MRRTDLVKLMDEALSISTEITMVVPHERMSVATSSSGDPKGRIETPDVLSPNAGSL